MKNLIVILDLQNVISEGGKDVILRHQTYADELYKTTAGRTTLRILTFRELSQFPPDERELFLKLQPSVSFPGGKILALRKFIRDNRNISLIISGDVFKSGLQVCLSQFTLRQKIPIQYQIHADIGAKGWATFNTNHRLKYFVARLVLKNAKYVRAVSKRQAANIQKMVNNKTKIDIIPVPLNLPEIARTNSKFHDPFTIGILGRMQNDRGIFVLGKFAREVSSRGLGVKFVCAGIESQDPTFQQIEDQIVSTAPIETLGNLPTGRLHEFWNEVDCLVSFAPFESYGRSMREAVSAGVKVISIPNSGALDLFDEVGPEWVSFWSPDGGKPAWEQIEVILNSPISNTKPHFAFQEENNVALLIQSWLDCR
jgi:glycosyltransferase involved in cell wall biosynthesis